VPLDFYYHPSESRRNRRVLCRVAKIADFDSCGCEALAEKGRESG
jgi:hypothetical protein